MNAKLACALSPLGRKMSNKTKILLICLALIVLALGFIIAIGIGRYEISLTHIYSLLRSYGNGEYSLESVILFENRLPRICAAILVGASLALSGGLYQGIIANPLVSPSILGVMSGASFGAALAMVLGFGLFGIEVMCFCFGILAMLCSLLLARLFSNSMSILMLILGGMITSAFFGAGMSILKYVADPYNTLPNIVFWLMGSLASIQLGPLVLLAVVFVAGLIFAIIGARHIDILNLDEQSAYALGVNVKALRVGFVIMATLLASASVAVGGLIGWVGLVVPHIARLIIGANHRFMLPFCAIFGAIFLLLCDCIARASFGVEIPIGLVSAIIGIPIFVLILMQKVRYER